MTTFITFVLFAIAMVTVSCCQKTHHEITQLLMIVTTVAALVAGLAIAHWGINLLFLLLLLGLKKPGQWVAFIALKR